MHPIGAAALACTAIAWWSLCTAIARRVSTRRRPSAFAGRRQSSRAWCTARSQESAAQSRALYGPDNYPEDFTCPISWLLMGDPVVLQGSFGGHSYEAEKIRHYITKQVVERGHVRDPMTWEPIRNYRLIPNRALKGREVASGTGETGEGDRRAVPGAQAPA